MSFVVGRPDTPFAYGCFLFDVYLPLGYPSSPPKVQHITPGVANIKASQSSGGLAPNLHQESGRVFLSSLDGFDEFGWNPAKANVYTILSTLRQKFLGVDFTNYCEPDCGAEDTSFTASCDHHKIPDMSLEKELQHRTIEYAILAPLIEPWRGFERVITRYFSSAKYEIVQQFFVWRSHTCDQNSSGNRDFFDSHRVPLLLALKRVTEVGLKEDKNKTNHVDLQTGNFLQTILTMEAPDLPQSTALSIDEGDYVPSSQNPPEQLSEQEAAQVEKCFRAAQVSKNMMMFHCLYREVVAEGLARSATPCQITQNLRRGGSTSTRIVKECPLQRMANGYDYWMCQLPQRSIRQIHQGLKAIENVSSVFEYYAMIGLPVPTPREQHTKLINGVRQSLRQGYHHIDQDFSRIQAMGVSNILMRGKSFERICYVIDVSGSMASQIGRFQISRLQFVQEQLQSMLMEVGNCQVLYPYNFLISHYAIS